MDDKNVYPLSLSQNILLAIASLVDGLAIASRTGRPWNRRDDFIFDELAKQGESMY